MKFTLHLLILTICSLGLSSCCSLLPCGSISGEKQVTTFAKGSAPGVPVTTTKRVTSRCFGCGSSFRSGPKCCGIVSSKVIARASAQASGEPNIGLIPTMKELATSD